MRPETKYRRSIGRYNTVTEPALKFRTVWTTEDDEFLWKYWGIHRGHPEKRTWVARSLGRTYVGCTRRYALLVKKKTETS